MPKKKKLISRKILKFELEHVMAMLDEHNYGYARERVGIILGRVDEYDLEQNKNLCILCKNDDCTDRSVHLRDGTTITGCDRFKA